MPRKLNPGQLKVGHGKAAPDEIIKRPALSGAGMVGPGPNIGEGDTPQTEEMAAALGLSTHLYDPKAAHMAAAIEHDGHPDVLISGNVEGALDELIGTVMDRPPYVGGWAPHTTFSGIPDWGHLKLRDQSLEYFGLLAKKPTATDAEDLFPYYFASPGPPQDTEFIELGGDPRTDHLWNDGMEGLGEPGMGFGRTHDGAFTRGGDLAGVNKETMRTHMLMVRPTGVDAQTGRPVRLAVSLSGTLFPADRGVIALFHFPVATGIGGATMQAEFLGQPLISDETAPLSAQGRVVAALLLGAGILDEACMEAAGDCEDAQICDGSPGGIFGVGTDEDGNHDPFAYPGRASGQYNLSEIHEGVDILGGDPLRTPWDDFNGDAAPGAARTATATVPAPGQVRLGTDPDSGVTAVSYGIPVLGGTSAMYAVAPIPQNGSLGFPIHGDAVVRDSNFFRYRLPVLADYSPTTGLKWTPRGEDATMTQEAYRYFQPAAPLAVTYPDGTAVGAALTSAGFYEGMFSDDYWVWQVARYRQTWLMPSIELDGDREEVGTYWLVHFKTEADFEKFARDGIFPWDATDGYEVYGSSLLSTNHVENDGNLANEWPTATAPVAPAGPPPLYGFTAEPYHLLRSTIMHDPDGLTMPAPTARAWSWASTSTPANEEVLWVSGVAYFTPRTRAAGLPSFTLPVISVGLAAGYWTSYRSSDFDQAATGEARIASMNPMFIGHAPFAYGPHPTGPASSLDLILGAPGVGHVPNGDFQRLHHFELPYGFLGANAGGVYGEGNGPNDADLLTYNTVALASPIIVRGDDDDPAFSQDAAVRAYYRRPLAHVSEDNSVLPFAAADGHGIRLLAASATTVLFHSTRFDKANRTGLFGNFVVAAFGGGLPNTSYTELYPASKDVEERFLDETYRYRPDFLGFSNPAGYNLNTIATLVGPGMGGWVGGPVETPVKVGLCTAAPFSSQSWLLMEDFLLDLSVNAPRQIDALQVGGLPDRNPPVSAAVEVPFPSSGLLLYPQVDYTAATSPAVGAHMTQAQPDYSGIVAGDRMYVRVLDLAFSHDVAPEVMAGQTEVTLRFDGIHMGDMLYRAPGPGGLGDNRISIMVKVPGLTTWMDVGRQDGAGPDKQDPILDGAGCLVLGATTYTFTDPVTGHRGCYLTIDVGPVATFFVNPAALSAYTVGSPSGEVPLLVKIQMDPGASNYNLKREFSGGVFGAIEPGADPRDTRGLLGFQVVRPDETLIDPDPANEQVMVLL